MMRQGMKEYLVKRYNCQCAKFPSTKETGLELYVRVNLAYMAKSDYWKNKEAK